MRKGSRVIVIGLVILSTIPFILNILINMFFSKLDTERYEKKKAGIEQRRQIEKMFPALNTRQPLKPKLESSPR